ncbi:hypothetical protein CEXT_574761 [Caerostris extrusa]|uniref:LAGLIDADG homing endonuclease n=1 Tax=Caerostris extrusa TaxID=172846 RepID=A0AAV4Q5G3_CAEEX|nr:hypothetical protein CEXT_574761 [Caerostris extrusa]
MNIEYTDQYPPPVPIKCVMIPPISGVLIRAFLSRRRACKEGKCLSTATSIKLYASEIYSTFSAKEISAWRVPSKTHLALKFEGCCIPGGFEFVQAGTKPTSEAEISMDFPGYGHVGHDKFAGWIDSVLVTIFPNSQSHCPKSTTTNSTGVTYTKALNGIKRKKVDNRGGHQYILSLHIHLAMLVFVNNKRRKIRKSFFSRNIDSEERGQHFIFLSSGISYIAFPGKKGKLFLSRNIDSEEKKRFSSEILKAFSSFGNLINRNFELLMGFFDGIHIRMKYHNEKRTILFRSTSILNHHFTSSPEPLIFRT